jgi:hypothetical protein
MRTTIDLPEDLHRLAREMARDKSCSLSETVAELMRRGLRDDRAGELKRDELTGLLTIRLGRPTTTEDVRSLEDDD